MEMQINQIPDEENEEEGEESICMERQNLRKVIETEEDERLIYSN